MKSVTQIISGQTAVTATAEAISICRDGTLHNPLAAQPSVADQGKIRLGGAYRLPMSRKIG